MGDAGTDSGDASHEAVEADFEILTPQFLLRPMRDADVTARSCAWFADEALTQHFAPAGSIDREALLSWVRRSRRVSTSYLVAICDRHSGLLIGLIRTHLRGDCATSSLIVGDRDHWGRDAAVESHSAWRAFLHTRGARRFRFRVSRRNRFMVDKLSRLKGLERGPQRGSFVEYSVRGDYERKPRPASAQEKRVIVTVAIGQGFEALAEATRPSMEAYARACRAHFVLWRDLPPRYRHAHFRRFAIPEELATFDRVLYLDADVMVRPGAPDLFARVPADHVGMCDEARFRHPAWARRRMARAIEFNNRVLRGRGERPLRKGWDGRYFNGGVTLTSRMHEPFHRMPNYDVCVQAWDGGDLSKRRVENQPYLNFRRLYLDLPMFDIGFRFNCTNPFMRANNRTLGHVRECHFFHATGPLENKLQALHKLGSELGQSARKAS